MDRASVPPTGVREKAICLPEVLASVFSWLRDERHTLRSVRLVSKQFLATANQFFRIHLTADYAIEHNCIQEAATIIGGLALTFPRIIPKELDILNRHLGLEPQDSVVTLDFCSMVARNCVHLETIKIVLEGPYSEEISQLLSCLFSQNPESAAVFRVRSLEFTLGFKFVESVVEDVRDHNLPDSCNGLLPATDYIPAESAFSRLEKMSLVRKFMVELPSMYRILQLKICPEVAAATSFLGPVCWNRMERAARLPAASLIAKPSRTLKIFHVPNTNCSIEELYSLQEQAPRLEEVDTSSAYGTNMSLTEEAAFARDSARSPGTLRLKRLYMYTMMDREMKLFLCRLLDTSVLESFDIYHVHGFREQEIPVNNNAEWLLPPPRSNILNEILDAMSVDPVSGGTQRRFLRKFGINSCDTAIENVNWLQRLKDTRCLHRLEKLLLPLSIKGFLDMFDTPVLLIPDSESSVDPLIAISGNVSEEKGPLTLQRSSLSFPACSSLLSFRVCGYDSGIIGKETSRRFADYLIRNMPRLRHLSILRTSFEDYTFLDFIAPPTVQPPATLSSPPLSLPSMPQKANSPGNDFKSTQDRNRHSEYNHLGLYRLESLSMSFSFMTRSEFRKLPKSERVMDLLKRRDDILARHPNFEREEEYDDFQLIEKALQMEGQRTLLEARTLQYHEDLMEQFLAVLGRFQRRKRESRFINNEHVQRNSDDPITGVGMDVVGLKQMTITQAGIPKEYVDKLKARAASQFPELDLKISSVFYQFER